ncbi:MAG: hypothetical protein HGA54_03885 [Actinobacteria bacterium]|nr:hypothetical protein [Actinomycetota bacterium]
MAGIPIDIKDVFQATGATIREQGEPIRVAIFVDATAPSELVSFLRQAFVPLSTNAFIHVEPFEDGIPFIDSLTDLAVIVAGASKSVSTLANNARNQGIPAVITCVDILKVMDIANTTPYPLSPVDIVAFTTKVEEGHDPTKEFTSSLGTWIVDHCRSKRLSFAASFAFIRRPLAIEITKATAFQNGAVGAVLIIPGADMPVMTFNQVKMVIQIAAAYGEELGAERVKELAAVLGGGFALRAIARQLVGIVPALGWAIKAGIGYSGTLAMGYAALEYFESGGDLVGVGQKVVAAREKAGKTATTISERRAMARDAKHRKNERIDIDAVAVQDFTPAALSLGDGADS